MSYSKLKERFKKNENSNIVDTEEEKDSSYQKLKDRLKFSTSQPKNEGNSNYQTLKDRFGGGSLSFADVGVDEKYINTFFTDASNFFKTAESDYKKIGWGNASSSYDTRYQTSLDLSERAGYVRAYINANKGNLSEEQYKSFISFLDEYDKGSSEIVTSFEGARDFYAQFESEQAYNDWYAYETDRQEKLSFDLIANHKTGETVLQHAEGYYNEAKALWGEVQNYSNWHWWWAKQASEGKITDNTKREELQKQWKQEREELQKQWNQKYGEQTIEDIEAEYKEKTAYYKEAQKLQNIEKLKADALSDTENLDHYSQIGDSISNPSWNDVDGKYGFLWIEPERAEIQNIVTYARDTLNDFNYYDWLERNSIRYGWSGDLTIYEHIKDEEYKVYTYYLGKGDKESADAYMENLKPTLQARKDDAVFKKLEGNTGLELLFGAYAGLSQFATGIANLGNQIFDRDPVQDPVGNVGAMVREDLADDSIPMWYNFKTGQWEDQIFGNSLGQIAYDATNTTANMLPSILVGTVTGSPVLGTLTLSASASGNGYAEMMNLGYSKDQARAYGIIVGITEGLLQYALGGITSLGGKVSGGLTNSIANKIDHALARVAIKIGGSMLAEGSEEMIQTILEPWFKSIVTGEDFEAPNIDEVLYSGLLGAITAGLLEGAGTIVSDRATVKKGQQVKNAGAVERLKTLGSTFSADSVAYKLAGKVDENTGAYKIGRLFNEINATLSEQNKTDIYNALIKNHILPQDAKTISETLAEIVEGQPFTDNVAEILNNNDIVSKVFFEEIIQKNSTVMQRMQGYGEIANALNTGTVFDNTTVEAENGSQTAEMAEVVNSSSEEQTTESPTENKAIEGKTTYNGEEVSVQKIESIEDGQVFVKLNNGKVVNAKEVDFATEEEFALYEAVTDMSVDTANAFILSYDRGGLRADGIKPLTVDEYINGFKDAVKYGQYGFLVTDLNRGVFTSALREQQRKIAYERGKADRMTAKVDQATISKTEKVDQNDDSVSSKTETKQKGEVVFADGLADAKPKTDQQKVGVEVAKVISKAFGNKIIFYASKVDKNGNRVFKDPLDGKVKNAPNGFYSPSTGIIYIDINAGKGGEGLTLYTLAHELTHDIKKKSPEAFNKFAEVVMEAYGKKGVSVHQLVQQQIEIAKEGGRTLTFDKAYEEVVANSCEQMLADSRAIQEISARIKAKDKGLWNTIKKFFTNLVAKIKAIYGQFSPQSTEGRLVGQMVDDFTRIQDAWINALFEANENSQSNKSLNTESVSMSEDGNIMLHMRQYRETGRSALRNYLVAQYGEVDADNLVSTIDSIYNTMSDIKGENEALSVFGNWQETAIDLDENGHPIFTTSIKNGDYELNQDFSRVCKKRRQLDFVLNMLAEDPAFEANHLTKQDFVKINKAIKEHGFEIACALCFVDSKRFRQSEWADSFANTWNDILNAVVKDSSKLTPFDFATKNPNLADDGIEIDENRPVMYRKWSEGKEDVKGRRNYDNLAKLLAEDGNANVKTIATLIRDNPNLRHTFRGADIIGSQGFDTMQRLAPAIRSILDGWGGSSVPKPSSNDASYDSSIINLESYNKEKAYAMGGARMNSFSDFMAHMFFDYCQAFADLSAKELPSQAYTKELHYVRFFGRSGQKINMSGIAAIRNDSLPTTAGKNISKAQAEANEKIEKMIAGLDVSRILQHLNKDIYELTEADVEQFLDMCDYVWADESINMKHATLLQTGILYDKLSDSKIEECYELLKAGEIEQALNTAGEENVDREYAKNCGTIVVGVSDAHIRKLLRDPTIRMVIPYHKSGLNPIVARELHISAFNDYTGVQNTGAILKGTNTRNGLTSNAIKGYGLKDFSFYDWFGKTIDGKLYDGKATADKYIEWCEKGYYDESVGDYVYYTTKGDGYILAKDLHKKLKIVPKFDAFMAEENYYKVLEDFDCYDTITGEHSAQGAVDFFHNGLPSDYKGILVDALKTEQKTADDFRDHLDNKGLKDEILGIVKKRGYTPSTESDIMYSSRNKDSWRDVNQIQGLEDYSIDEVSDIVRQHIENLAMDFGEKISIIDIRPYGSRARGTAKNTSDLDVVVQYEGDIREDDMFNMLNDEDKLVIDGIEVDINPIKADDTGTIDEYLDRVYDYDKYADILYSSRDSQGNTLTAEQQEFFKDSKVRDENGNLLVVYNGVKTQRDGENLDLGFTYHFLSESLQFKNQPNRFGFFFTDNKTTAEDYSQTWRTELQAMRVGRVNEVYLNIKNPLDLRSLEISSSEKDFYKLLENNGVITYRSRYKSDYKPVWRRFDKDGETLRRQIESAGYDGVIFHDYGEDNATYIVFNSNQIKLTTNKTPTSDPDIRYSSRGKAPTFYSQMGKVVEGMKQEKFSASSVIPMLRGRGVKAEEIRWGGIATWLEGKKSVTKQELLEFINGSMLQIGEQMSDNVEIEVVSEDGDNWIVRDKASKTIIDEWEYSDDVEDGLSGWMNNEGEIALSEYELKEKAFKDFSSTRWSEYKLEGGENYREVVFTMPNSTYSNKAMRVHWGEDSVGVLAHARIQDFVVDGKKMLFIEEIQSDWHNEGKRKGYRNPSKRLQEFWSKTGSIQSKIDDLFMEWEYNPNSTDPHQKISKLQDELDKITEEYKDVLEEAKKEAFQIPDAPFKDNYHEFVLKRLLRMASEEGYDSIGWTPADIQSKRWSEDYAEGYRIEYDQDIPKFLRKYGRQWGATIGKSNLPNNIETKVWSMDLTDSMKDTVVNEGQVMYSSRTNIVDMNGKEYDHIIELDYKIFNKVKRSGKAYIDFIRNNLINQKITVYNSNGVEEVIEFARANERVKKDGVERSHPVIGELTQARNEIKKIVILNAVETVKISQFNPSTDHSNENSHQWLDANGWDYRTSYVMTKEGMIYPVTLFVAKTRDGRNILYDVNVKIKEGVAVDKIATSKRSKKNTRQAVKSTKPSGNMIHHNSDSVNQNTENSDNQNFSRNQDSISNRSLLANALESAAQNDIEKQKLAQYKEKIDLINSEEAKLHDLREQIKDLSFAKGRKDTATINKLQAEATQTANRINTYDRQLLNLEASKPLKDVLEREKKLAYKRAEQRGKEALAEYKERAIKTQKELMDRARESRQKSIERRNATEMRHKIKKVVSDLNNLLLHGSKERNVKLGLQEAVADALEAINLDTVDAENRIARLQEELLKAKAPEKIAEIQHKIDFIRNQGDNFADKLEKLRKAYSEIKQNGDKNLPSQFKEEASLIHDRIEKVVKDVGDTPLRNMSLAQLQEVYDMYKMVLTTIRNANSIWREGKLIDLQQNASTIMSELEKINKLKSQELWIKDKAREFLWNEMTPYYAFQRIGSETFAQYYQDIVEGQNTYARDVSEAKDFASSLRKKYGHGKWDLDKVYEFKCKDGRTFSTTLKHLLSIYAYSKREQALAHMKEGGFFHNDKATFRKGKGGILKFIRRDEIGYKIDEEILEEIKGSLTKEQIGYVDEMQEYLTKMGEKGNEVTRVMWGIDIFKEKVYFPLKSVTDFVKRSTETAQSVSLKNDGMTKETVPGASNPIVLESFDDVWASHVDRMSQYHAFVIPIDNLNKVSQYGSWVGTDSMTVSTMIKARFGSEATNYIEQFIKDLNGGVTNQGAKHWFESMFSKFKKTAVGMSLSTVVQQPTAIFRAMAVIDGKYFVGKPNLNTLGTKWAELKKYAPVAIIKDIGGFDAGGGKQASRWLNSDTLRGKDKAMDTIDNVAMKGAEVADKLGWTTIWEAVKREVKANNPSMDVNSEAFLEKCGKRFTEVIVQTQVYDSTLSRSGYMRSKNALVKLSTAFMGEPTLSINMLLNSVTQAKRGKTSKGKAIKVIASVYTAQIAASAVSSLIYALRDDDEDESYLEKYMQVLGGEFISDLVLLPINSLPFMKDIVTILQGWDVERTDIAPLQDIYNATIGLWSENKTPYRKVEDFAGAVGNFAGVPVKNLLRTGREIYNLFNGIFDGIEDGDLGHSFAEGFIEGVPIVGHFVNIEKSKSDKLYEAILSGDEGRLEIYRKEYKDEDAYNTAVRKALRDNDSRIREAAQARIDGDIAEYSRIAREIIAEGNFNQDTVVGAINSEINAIKKESEKNETEKPDDGKEEVTSIYSANDINSAFDNGDNAFAKKIIAELIDVKVANGKTEKEAKSSIRSSMTSYWKPLYREAYKNRDSAELTRIRTILYNSGVYGTVSDVVKTAQNWLKED